MCWISGQKPIPILASYDIPIYKRVCKRRYGFAAPYRSYVYSPNTWEPKVQLKVEGNSPHGMFGIREGYHCYSNLAAALPNRCYGEIVVAGYIKKGTEFYQNSIGEIVAEQIMITTPKPKNKWYTTILKFIGLG